ncbi:MAG: hypothetical protein M3442_15905 [Chloroflexota bacterium]|nr:hypothetical protein [Chloroflexota bacterium]
MIVDRSFGSKATSTSDHAGAEGWDPIEGRYGNFTIVADPSAPRSASTVGQMFYPGGFTGGKAPGLAQVAFPHPGGRQVYISMWVKLSPNFQGQQSNTNKMLHMWVNGGNRLFISAEGRDTNRLIPQVRLQGVPDPRARITPNVATGAQIVRGVWQQWELLLTVNTPGQRDGEAQWWLDGRLITDVRDLEIVRVGESPTWDQFQWSPTWGGGGDTVDQDMFLWFDHVYISGR